MKTFEEYQALAAKVPVSLRDNRERVELPALGLQEEAAAHIVGRRSNAR